MTKTVLAIALITLGKLRTASLRLGYELTFIRRLRADAGGTRAETVNYWPPKRL